MNSRGHKVYRGRRAAGSRLPAVLLFLAVFIALLGLTAFSMLPQYLVYHRDGVEMVVPILEESGQGYTVTGAAGPQPYGQPVSASIQVTAPDYTNVDMADGRSLTYLQAYYLPFSKITEGNWDSAISEASRSLDKLAKGVVLEMKAEDGKLAWISNVPMASSIAANGTWDPSAELAELKADGWTLAAKISCSVDTLLATQDPDVALRDASGNVYADGSGSWVDLWNKDVRNYIAGLCMDLIDMGFDEIILSHVEHPPASVSYTREIAAGLGTEAYVMNFSIAVRQALTDSMAANSARLSAVVSHDVLGAGASNGQSLVNFLRVYDRVVIPTGTYTDDVPVFLENHYDSTLRFVPQMTWGFGGGSWIIDPAAPQPAAE